MSVEGVDYSSGRPGGKALAAAGMAFAARYLSHNASKNLNPTEATDLAAHGVSAVVVWETTANRASAGRAAGVADAKEAAAQAKACGMPSGRPIFFAVDYDAAPSAVVAYFQGVASVLGVSRTGVYGGYKVVTYLLDHKLAAWAWQTVAWSQGRWDPRAHIRQYASTVRIGGVSCDKDTAMTADYGQWMPGKLPTPKDPNDMADITPTQMDQIALKAAQQVAGFKNPTLEPKGPDLRQRIVNAETNSKAAADGVKALAAKPTAVALTDAQVATVADRLASNPAFAAAIADRLAADLATRLAQ